MKKKMRWLTIVEDEVPIVSLNRWGPNGWKFITACAFAYPLTPSLHERDRMARFLNSMQYVLPCYKCRIHYGQNLQDLDDNALASRVSLLQWINTVRNRINASEGKPAVTFEEMIRSCVTGCKHHSLFTISHQRFIQLVMMVILVILVGLLFIV